MKRLTRRSLAVTFGLILGWLAQGWSAGLLPEVNQVHASETEQSAHMVAESHGEDKGVVAADLLAQAGQDAAWYKIVLWIAGGLFIAAVVIGIPAMKLSWPQHEQEESDHDTAGAH